MWLEVIKIQLIYNLAAAEMKGEGLCHYRKRLKCALIAQNQYVITALMKLIMEQIKKGTSSTTLERKGEAFLNGQNSLKYRMQPCQGEYGQE